MAQVDQTQTPASLRQRIRDAGLKWTASRGAVLLALLQADKPLSHAELTELLDAHGFDRATIYRNLMDLTGGGLVARADMGDHVWRFEAKTHEAALHPHFMCTSCGAVQCLPESAVDVFAPAIKGAVRRVDEVLLKGACAACA